MRFPHANEEMSDEEFIAYWAAWFAGPTSPGMLCACSAVPNLASAVGMQTLYDKNNGHGLDALCRRIVRPVYRNTMQATRSFMTANAHMLEQVSAGNPHTGQIVKGARLTKRGLEVLRAVRENAAGSTSRRIIPMSNLPVVAAERDRIRAMRLLHWVAKSGNEIF